LSFFLIFDFCSIFVIVEKSTRALGQCFLTADAARDAVGKDKQRVTRLVRERETERERERERKKEREKERERERERTANFVDRRS
jgi:hypothetical protein